MLKLTLVPWCGALFFFAWRVQALLAWSGAHGSLDQGTGVLILHVVCHHGSAQQNTSCDKWHKTYHQFAWWLVVVFCLSCNFLKHVQAVKAFANNSQRWISIAAKISGWCGNCLQFIWILSLISIYVQCILLCYIIFGWSRIQSRSKTIKQAYLKSARGNGQHSFKRVDSGHLDADICFSVEPQQVLDRCTAWRMWPIAIARKRRRSSFTLKLDWENGSWRLPFALMRCVFFPFVFSICCETYWRILLNDLKKYNFLLKCYPQTSKQGTKAGTFYPQRSWLPGSAKCRGSAQTLRRETRPVPPPARPESLVSLFVSFDLLFLLNVPKNYRNQTGSLREEVW